MLICCSFKKYNKFCSVESQSSDIARPLGMGVK